MLLRLPWHHIVDAYSGEWVELIQYRWDIDAPYPRWGVVRNHNGDREELLATLSSSVKRYPNSVILFVHAHSPLINKDPQFPYISV